MSEDILGRADSLMRRSRTFVAGRTTPAPADDGIPLLTDEVDLGALSGVADPLREAALREATERVSGEVAARVTEQLQQATSDALSREFADLPERIQQRIDDWCATSLPALVSIEMQVALEAALSAAVDTAAARIREQAVIDLREQIAADIEKRSQAVLNATLSPAGAPDQPL